MNLKRSKCTLDRKGVSSRHVIKGLHCRDRAIKLATLQRLKRLVFVSPQLRDAFDSIAETRAGLSTVIPNGIDSERFENAKPGTLRDEFGIGCDEFPCDIWWLVSNRRFIRHCCW